MVMHFSAISPSTRAMLNGNTVGQVDSEVLAHPLLDRKANYLKRSVALIDSSFGF